MNAKRPWRGVVVLAITVALASSGCSRFTGSSGSSEDKTLTMWTEQYDGGNAGLQSALTDFTAKTGIKVKYTAYSTDALKQALKNAMGTKAMPDVFQSWTGIGLTGPYMKANAVQALDTYYQKYNWDARLLPGAVNIATFDGKKMAVPFNIHAMAIVYNKSVFAKAGITSTPKTYAALLADMATLKSKGIVPFSLAGKFSWDTMRLLDSLIEVKCGATTFDAVRNLQDNWTQTPCVQQGFAELQTWVKDYLPKDYMGLDPNSNQMYTAIYAGKAAMTIDGDWSVGTLTDGKQDLSNYAFFPFPTGTNRLAFFTESLWMSSTSSHQDEAAQLMDYLTSDAVQTKYFSKLNTVVSPDKNVKAPSTVVPYSQQWISTIGQYSGVFQLSDQALPPDVADSYLRNQDKVVLGQETPAKAVAAIQSDIDTYKSQNQ